MANIIYRVVYSNLDAGNKVLNHFGQEVALVSIAPRTGTDGAALFDPAAFKTCLSNNSKLRNGTVTHQIHSVAAVDKEAQGVPGILT